MRTEAAAHNANDDNVVDGQRDDDDDNDNYDNDDDKDNFAGALPSRA